ncbi:MAG: addiction module protein [Pirellulales bacterium]
MNGYSAVLAAAQQLPDEDRLRLIDALWATLPPEATVAISEEWGLEIERRVAELDAGIAETVPWSKIHAVALGKIDRNL